MDEMSGARPGARPGAGAAATEPTAGAAGARPRPKFCPTMNAKRERSAIPATAHGRMVETVEAAAARAAGAALAAACGTARPSRGAPQR